LDAVDLTRHRPCERSGEQIPKIAGDLDATRDAVRSARSALIKQMCDAWRAPSRDAAEPRVTTRSAANTVRTIQLVATGLVNSVAFLGSLRTLTSTNYDRLLLFKVVLFLAMLSLAAVNRIRLTPIIRNDRYAAPAAFKRLRTNAFVEAAIGFAILAIVGLLGTTSPTE
jgi:putative copper export protein